MARPRELACPIVGCEGQYKEGKPLTQHMNQVHELDLGEMIENYPDLADMFYWGAKETKVDRTKSEFKLPKGDFEEAVLSFLTQDERKYYEERFDFYFQSVDRDPGCIPDIRNLIIGEIHLQKLNANAMMDDLTEAKKK